MGYFTGFHSMGVEPLGAGEQGAQGRVGKRRTWAGAKGSSAVGSSLRGSRVYQGYIPGEWSVPMTHGETWQEWREGQWGQGTAQLSSQKSHPVSVYCRMTLTYLLSTPSPMMFATMP